MITAENPSALDDLVGGAAPTSPLVMAALLEAIRSTPANHAPVTPGSIDPGQRPPRHHAGRPVFEVLERRVSQRFFGSRPVSRELCEHVVAAMRAADRGGFAAEAAHRPIQILCAANTVAGLRRGLQLAGEPGWTWLADLPTGEHAADLVLQREFAAAPAVFLVVGPLADSLAEHGEHGYRLLLERAGGCAYAGVLAALDTDATGSIFAGFIAAALGPMAGIDGFRQLQLLALAVGHPDPRPRIPT